MDAFGHRLLRLTELVAAANERRQQQQQVNLRAAEKKVGGKLSHLGELGSSCASELLANTEKSIGRVFSQRHSFAALVVWSLH